MKKIQKLKLHKFELLSKSDMKNIIGAMYSDLLYTCDSLPNGFCSNSQGGICGNIGRMGICKVSGTMNYEYDSSGNYSILNNYTCYCDV